MQTSPAGHRGAVVDAGSQALPRFEPEPQTWYCAPEGVWVPDRLRCDRVAAEIRALLGK